MFRKWLSSYITGKLSDVHGMHGILIDVTAIIVPLHVIGVILLVFILQLHMNELQPSTATP